MLCEQCSWLEWFGHKTTSSMLVFSEIYNVDFFICNLIFGVDCVLLISSRTHSTSLCPTHSLAHLHAPLFILLTPSLITPISFSLIPSLRHSFIPSIHLPPQSNFLSHFLPSSPSLFLLLLTFFTSQFLTPRTPLPLSPKTSPILLEDPPTWNSPDQ